MAIDDNASYELTGYQVKDLAQKIRAKADSASLASVATSGLYSDLTGAPTIPTVYNGTLTITQGGNTLGTFTANSSTNETIDIPAGGSSYTAGTGIDITNDTISIDRTVVAELSDIPTVNDATLTITQNGTTAGTFTANQSTNETIALTDTTYTAGANVQISAQNVISATDTTYSDFTGATSSAAGAHGLVPAPAAGDEGKFLQGNGTWATVSTGTQYIAGSGINIDANNEISVDTTVVAEVSDIPTQTSDLTNNGSDGTSTYVETDELATVATSGSFNDLIDQPTIPAAQVNSDWNASSGVAEILNKPTIPTVNNATLTVTQNGTSAGTFTANASSDVTIALTDTTYSAMTGATSSTAGTAGLVPAPAAGDEAKVLSGAGTWVSQPSGQEKAFYYVGYGNNDPGYSERTLTLYSDAGRTTTATVQSMADDYFGGKEVHFCYIDTRGYYPIVDTIITSGANKYEGGTADSMFTFGSLFHGRNYITTGVLNGYGTKSGTTVTVSYRPVPTVYDATLTVQHNGTNKGTFTANAQYNKTINIETIYADDYIDTTALTPIVSTSMIEDGAVATAKIDDGAVTAAKIDWSTIYDELYNSSTGTGKNTTFNISASAANYTRLKVFFKSNDGDFGSVDVYNPDGKTFSTTILHPVTGVIYIKNTLWSISGSTITMGKAVQGMLGNTTSVSDASYIYIVRVEGWKI